MDYWGNGGVFTSDFVYCGWEGIVSFCGAFFRIIWVGGGWVAHFDGDGEFDVEEDRKVILLILDKIDY